MTKNSRLSFKKAKVWCHPVNRELLEKISSKILIHKKISSSLFWKIVQHFHGVWRQVGSILNLLMSNWSFRGPSTAFCLYECHFSSFEPLSCPAKAVLKHLCIFVVKLVLQSSCRYIYCHFEHFQWDLKRFQTELATLWSFLCQICGFWRWIGNSEDSLPFWIWFQLI